jgi:hypothetical protein
MIDKLAHTFDMREEARAPGLEWHHFGRRRRQCGGRDDQRGAARDRCEGACLRRKDFDIRNAMHVIGLITLNGTTPQEHRSRAQLR